MKKIFVIGCSFLLLLPVVAQAERADAFKRLSIKYKDLYYDSSDVIKLISMAMLRQLEGQSVTHQMEQAHISYDNRNDVLLGRNAPDGATLPSNDRGTITIEARRHGLAVPASTSKP